MVLCMAREKDGKRLLLCGLFFGFFWVVVVLLLFFYSSLSLQEYLGASCGGTKALEAGGSMVPVLAQYQINWAPTELPAVMLCK